MEGDIMSAVMKEQLNLLTENNESQWEAVLTKDARRDGQFVFAVSSTGIYCRPSCGSRRPRRENVSFYQSPESAEQAGFRACLRCHPRDARATDPQVEMAQAVCRIIEESEGEAVSLAALSAQLGVSSFHLQRTFKNVMGITPKDYAETWRVKRFKQGVRQGEAVTSAMYDAGFGSSSRLYETASSELGMTPATYGKGGRGAVINYTVAETPLGQLLVAATGKGVCSVMLGDSEATLKADLLREFPAAEIHQDEKPLRSAVKAIVDHLKSKTPRIDLPLDIQATAFQRQVWEQLRAIPYGETHSYSEVAKALGQVKAVRAVARACATNPVALVVPCHRVIREDKSLGGYRWGLDRKRKLLETERETIIKGKATTA
ncbi:MAG TPA: bifunctional DNA-binding transcriptional regulator/O6-methylguanine-DNA methyltransferase Ada [Pyrinomonadaceae bacterium]|jgi:AraC family transcriptional regulator of adaptative response/methylated-DNA-[protein]-cysteine methyltransferase|nr:bifunctional DNA-binding transcriptional regulator/O6-methylguanine-DNA methyltransferase Ada [Pyrinomonadaceae bacterium]